MVSARRRANHLNAPESRVPSPRVPESNSQTGGSSTAIVGSGATRCPWKRVGGARAGRFQNAKMPKCQNEMRTRRRVSRRCTHRAASRRRRRSLHRSARRALRLAPTRVRRALQARLSRMHDAFALSKPKRRGQMPLATWLATWLAGAAP